MINTVTLVGRLTKDIELKTVGQGVEVANFSLAVERNFKNQNGEKEADFIDVVAFRKTAELLAQYTQKGNMIAVRGRLQSRSYENQEGRRVYVTEVIADEVQFLTPRNDQAQNVQQQREEMAAKFGAYQAPQPQAPVQPQPMQPMQQAQPAQPQAPQYEEIRFDGMPF